jgi:beta-mannosidase
VTAILKLCAFDIETGDPVELPNDERARRLELKANGTTEIAKIGIPKVNHPSVYGSGS